MKRSIFTSVMTGGALLALLSACAPPVPNDVSPVVYGGTDPVSNARRDAMLEGTDPAVITQTPLGGASDAETVITTSQPDTSNAAAVNSTGISAENDFNRVGELRSIESDAQRIENLRNQYEQVQPTAVPTRSRSGSPNIVQYALSTTNTPGQPIYGRISLRTKSAYERKCAQFASADQAQVAFLSNGGPQKDRGGLDPDGDGFACGWDPTPFRRAISANSE